jgi:hypothetical protein
MVAIPGNRQHQPAARCYTTTSSNHNHKQYPSSSEYLTGPNTSIHPHHPQYPARPGMLLVRMVLHDFIEQFRRMKCGQHPTAALGPALVLPEGSKILTRITRIKGTDYTEGKKYMGPPFPGRGAGGKTIGRFAR